MVGYLPTHGTTSSRPVGIVGNMTAQESFNSRIKDLIMHGTTKGRGTSAMHDHRVEH